MNTLLELNKFNKFTFRDSDHTYFCNNEAVGLSTTGLVGQYEQPFNQYIISRAVANKRHISQQEVLDEWQANNDTACVKGSIVHSYIENLIAGKLDNDVGEYTAVKNQVNRFWNSAKNRLIPVRTEFIIGDEDYDLCGMVDAIFWNVKEQELQVWDWKTNREFKIVNSRGDKMLPPFSAYDDCHINTYSLQLEIYKHIIEKNTNLKIGNRYLAHFSETDFNIYKCNDMSRLTEVILNQRRK